MSKHWKSFKKYCFEMFTGEQEVNTKSVLELVTNSEYSKSENFKKLSVLAHQILSLLSKDTCTLILSE